MKDQLTVGVTYVSHTANQGFPELKDVTYVFLVLDTWYSYRTHFAKALILCRDNKTYVDGTVKVIADAYWIWTNATPLLESLDPRPRA